MQQPQPTNPPVTQAPTTKATTKASGTFICPSGGHFKNPSDCSSYYNCGWAGETPAPMPCSAGLKWNDPIKTCDLPQNVVC